MGQAYAHVLTVLESEFVRVQETDDVLEAAKSINYIQLRQIRLPEEYQLNTKHVGVLFCVDFNKDGVFSYDDLRNFLSWCCEVLPSDVGDDVAANLQGRCLLKLWSDCRRAPEGDDVFFDWLLSLMQRTYPKHVWKPESAERSVAECSTTTDDESDDGLLSEVADGGESASVDLLSAENAEGRRAPTPSASGKHRFGPACIALVYDMLQVDAVHGLSYPVFVNLLHAAGGSDPTMPVIDDVDSPTFGASSPLRSQAGDDAMDYAAPSFDVPEGDDIPGGNPLQSWVSESALRGFVNAFLASLWTTLERLGLQILTDGH